MAHFLSVFEAKALAEGLTEAGHSVSERTVQRWKAGKTKPKPQDIRAIRELIGVLIHEKEAPMPDWAQGLEQRLTDAVLTNREIVVQALVEQTARLAYERVLDEQPPAEPAPGKRVTPPARAAREPRR